MGAWNSGPTPIPAMIWNKMIFQMTSFDPKLMNNPVPSVIKKHPNHIAGLTLPVLPMNIPVAIVQRDKGRIKAKSSTPEIMGERPRTAWKYKAR